MKKLGLALALSALPGMALATNGYFSHGYGMTAKGMGGAATALTKDAFGGANNPASMVWVGNRIDVGVDWFSPKRSMSRTGGVAGIDGAADSGSNNFFIPEFGYNRMLNPSMALGLTVYGNGGMNTDYAGGQITPASACSAFNPGQAAYNVLCGAGTLGIDMMQLIIAPTLAMKLTEQHSIGVAPLFGYQRFKAEGLGGFAGFTSSMTPNNLTNRGYDSAHGWGVRLGWLGKINDRVTLGAAYSSKIRMSKFDKYQELFADQGDFDVPENYNLGLAFKASEAVTVALDYQRVNYGGVRSVSNPSTNNAPLGASNGRGFGWGDVDIVKIGVEYQYSPALTLRAGYDRTKNPIGSRDVTFNIIAPGVVEDHLTLGLTYAVSKSADVTVAYMHAFKNSVSGASLYNGFGVPAGNEKIEMYQNSLGIAYSWKM